MSKTNGKSLPELKREQAKLTEMIAREEADQLLKKRARERELVKSEGKVLVPQSPSKSPSGLSDLFFCDYVGGLGRVGECLGWEGGGEGRKGRRWWCC